MIDIIKNTIVSSLHYDYENIILFGSRARGTNDGKSDYDILVVIKEEISDKDKIFLATKIRKSLADKNIDADIIVRTKLDIEYYRNKIGSVVNKAVKEGVIL